MLFSVKRGLAVAGALAAAAGAPQAAESRLTLGLELEGKQNILERKEYYKRKYRALGKENESLQSEIEKQYSEERRLRGRRDKYKQQARELQAAAGAQAAELQRARTAATAAERRASQAQAAERRAREAHAAMVPQAAPANCHEERDARARAEAQLRDRGARLSEAEAELREMATHLREVEGRVL